MISYIFYYFFRLSRARNKSENAFGILTHRFEIYRAPVRGEPKDAIKYIMATLCLHNWLMNQPGTIGRYQDDCPQIPHSGFFQNVSVRNASQATRDAQHMRDELCTFFNGAGAVPWQLDRI